MSDSECTHEIPAVSDAPPGTLVFDLPDPPPYVSRVVATLRLLGGYELVVGDGRECGAVFINVVDDGGGGYPRAAVRAALRLTSGEAERLILAIRSAHDVEG